MKRLRQALVIGAISSGIGCSDSPTGTGGIKPPPITNQDLCQSGCVLLENSAAFWSAQSSADSAGYPILVASVGAEGNLGDRLTLRLFAGEAWLRAIGAEARIVVVGAGFRRSLLLNSLLDEATIYRFAGREQIELRLQLPREYDSLPAYPIRLVLRSHGAIVREGQFPFRSSKATGPQASTEQSACPFLTPGVHCGVTVTIDPFYAVGYNGPGISSRPNTGASVPMRMTFNPPVSKLRITVNDPDFDGNQVIAVAGGAVSVPYDGHPGVLTTYDVYFPGDNISTVDLVPAPEDHVWYTLTSFSVDSADIVVACSPNPLDRGQDVNCQASLPPGASNLAVSEWRFETSDLPSPITEATPATSWPGKMAVTGQVKAVGTVDGQPGRGETTVTVRDRIWTAKQVQYSHEDLGSAGLPERPTRVGELGATANIHPSSFIPPNGWVAVNSGPNRGVVFFTEVPIQAASQIAINRIALAVNSDFWKRQPANNPPPGKCRRSDVVPFMPLVEAHEGTQLQPLSHAGVYRDTLNGLVPQQVERAVGLNLDAALIKALQLAQPGISVALQRAGDTPSGIVPPVPYCTFKYF